MRNERYTDADVLAAWYAYAAARPTEHIIKNTMRDCRPQNVGNCTYDVALKNDIQTEEFRKHLDGVLIAIRNATKNDYINITLSLNEAGPAPMIWNDREILAHLTSVSPNVVKLIDKFNLKLI